MASALLLVNHGDVATAVQKKACRAAAAYAASAATATTAAAAASAVLLLLLLLLLLCCCLAAAVLLLCCCCCHIRVPLLRVPKKICCASRCQSIFPFFDTRLFVFFGELMNFKNDASDMEASNAISAIRSSQTQSKSCPNEFGLFQVRRNYWLNNFYRKHSNDSDSRKRKAT